MHIETEPQLDFKDVLIRPKRSFLSSRSEVSLIKEYKFRSGRYQWRGVPIAAANMDTVGTFSMARELAKSQCMTALHKHYEEDRLVEFFNKKESADEMDLLANNRHSMQHSLYSMGILDKDYEKFERVLSKVGTWRHGVKDEDNYGIKMVCIDVANGYMQSFVNFCRKFREAHPDLIVMAGNVVTGDIVEELIFSGVDIVKIGIGPGSACTTRRVAGVGRSQLSAIIETADAAHGLGGHIVSDGGCVVPADLAKAFGAGADFVMLGGMLSGHDESELEPYDRNGEKYVRFYGMSSAEAMEKHAGGVAVHRAAEGKSVEIKYRGGVSGSMSEILGGLRSACSYVGAKNLKELPKRTTFYKVSMQTNDAFGNF